MNPEISTYSHYIREKIAQIHAALRDLSQDDLNRAPDVPGANTAYALATHTFGNMRAWVLGIICGVDLRRDRPAEFASRGTYQELGKAACELSGEIQATLQTLDPATLADRFVRARELWGEGDPVELERRGCLAYVLEHAGIHLGHIQMTVELLEAQR
ncbi:MAG: DinB family protein [Chloroflexota bacterium]|nr:DinB family protein [Chloroflexota bacterium]